MMAAGQAVLAGARVTLLEKKDSPARKLRLTGNGRCNLTNAAPIEEFLARFGRNGKFLRTAFSRFFASELMRFFESLGIRLYVDDRGLVYPRSNNADDVAEALMNWAIRCGVKILCKSPVTKILASENCVLGVQLTRQRAVMPADIVILATGGASYPGTGSTGDGYALAESLGHTIVPIRPASVPLLTGPDIAPKLQGMSLNSVAIDIKIGGKSTYRAAGDLLFTHYGLSGPVTLSASRVCVDFLQKGQRPVMSIDLLPKDSEDHLERMILSSFQQHGGRQAQAVLGEFIPNRMATVLLSLIGIEATKLCSQVTAEDRRRIVRCLKGLEIEITGHRPLAEAMVTAGGVSLKVIDPRTMESRLVKGLYFAGEVLDFDADTGGFNLQAAFSTGWLAGQMGGAR